MSLELFDKHFRCWITEHAHYTLGDEPVLAQAFASALGGGTVSGEHESAEHGTRSGPVSIDLKDMADFIMLHSKETRDNKDFRCACCLEAHAAAVLELASGKELRSEGASDEVKELRDWIQVYVLPHGHTTHRTEAGVREVSLVSTRNTSETTRNVQVLERDRHHLGVREQLLGELRAEAEEEGDGGQVGRIHCTKRHAHALLAHALDEAESSATMASHRKQARTSRKLRLKNAQVEAGASAEEAAARYATAGGTAQAGLSGAQQNVLTLSGQQRGAHTVRVAGLAKQGMVGTMVAELQYRKTQGKLEELELDELPKGCRALATLIKEKCSFASDTSDDADLLVRGTHKEAAAAAAAAAAADGADGADDDL